MRLAVMMIGSKVIVASCVGAKRCAVITIGSMTWMGAAFGDWAMPLSSATVKAAQPNKLANMPMSLVRFTVLKHTLSKLPCLIRQIFND